MQPCTNPSHHNPKSKDRYEYGLCRAGRAFPCHNNRLPNGMTICDSTHHTHPERTLPAAKMDTLGTIALLRAICLGQSKQFRREMFKYFSG